MERLQGLITSFKQDKGYGFISRIGVDDTDGTDVLETFWFHVKNCRTNPQVGLRVSFEYEVRPKGFVALDVRQVVEVPQNVQDALGGK
jgi:cold shock CspA family protein